MTKREMLELLDSLVNGAEKSVSHADDPSGIFTEYVLDTEAFRKNIQTELEKLKSQD